MPIKLVKCAVSVSGGSGGTGARTYMFLAPKGLYKLGVATATGIAELADDSTDLDEPIYRVEELIKARKLVRIIAQTQEGTVKRHVKMFCSKNKIGSIDDDLKDKVVTIDGAKVSGSKVKSVVAKRDASFY